MKKEFIKWTCECDKRNKTEKTKSAIRISCTCKKCGKTKMIRL